MFLHPFGLYCNACFGILFVSILCTCCGHFSWYCFISFTIFCALVFSLIHRFFSLSSFVIPSKRLKNFICAASKHCSSLSFSTQASLPNCQRSTWSQGLYRCWYVKPINPEKNQPQQQRRLCRQILLPRPRRPRPRDPWAMQLKLQQTGEGAGESPAS